MPATFDNLPRVSTKKEFMDTIAGIMSAEAPAEDEEETYDVERRGRPRELKSYIFEANSELPAEIRTKDVSGTIQSTGLENLKILRLISGQREASFYLDRSDSRFLILHSGALADEARWLIDRLVSSPAYQFDRAWIPTQLLRDISNSPGNEFNGFGLEYEDLFAPKDTEEIPVEELNMFVSGTIANKALGAVMGEKDLQRSLSYTRTRIKRGTAMEYAKDDIAYNGALSVKSGRSVDDHMALVEETKTKYRELVKRVEALRLGTKESGGRVNLGGKAFNLVFDRNIENITHFLDTLLSGNLPFRLWGIRSKIDENYYQAFALDLHTGHNLDIEITPSFIRAYLPDGTCGNSLLRLYVNLQRYFDSKTSCEEIFA